VQISALVQHACGCTYIINILPARSFDEHAWCEKSSDERAGGRERRKLNLVRRILCFSSSSSSALPEERALSRARRRAVCALIVPAPTHPPPPTHSGPFVVSGAHNSFLASLVARSPTCHARPGKVGGWLCTIGCSARAATGENKNQLPFRPFSVARERERSRAPHAK